MFKTLWLCLFALALPLLAGCNASPATLTASDIILPPADEQVAESALRYTIALYERDDRGVFVAYVLPKSELSDRLVEALRDVSPLVSNRLSVSMEGGLAHERVSGIPVKLWMVRPLVLTPPEAPTHATVEVAWYQGIGDSRLFTLTLECRAGQWVVTEQKMETFLDPNLTAADFPRDNAMTPTPAPVSLPAPPAPPGETAALEKALDSSPPPFDHP